MQKKIIIKELAVHLLSPQHEAQEMPKLCTPLEYNPTYQANMSLSGFGFSIIIK